MNPDASNPFKATLNPSMTCSQVEESVFEDISLAHEMRAIEAYDCSDYCLTHDNQPYLFKSRINEIVSHRDLRNTKNLVYESVLLNNSASTLESYDLTFIETRDKVVELWPTNEDFFWRCNNVNKFEN